LASWAPAKDKHGGSKGFVLQEISGSARGKKKRGGDTKQNNGGGRLIMQSKGVVVNGSGNGISRIM
jgi:hypothetical protein